MSTLSGDDKAISGCVSVRRLFDAGPGTALRPALRRYSLGPGAHRDISISKAIASRPKDVNLFQSMLDVGVVKTEVLQECLEGDSDLDDQARRARQWRGNDRLIDISVQI